MRTPVAVEEAVLQRLRRPRDVKNRFRWSASSNTNAPSTTLIGAYSDAEGRRALDVDVDVAGRDRRDAVGVAAELAGAEDLGRQPDVAAASSSAMTWAPHACCGCASW